MGSAEDFLAKACDLLEGAMLLHRAHHDHAAFVCAIHAGINAADAIGHHDGYPFAGTEHRKAADHLRQLDASLSKPAQSLRRLADRKSTVEYREARFTRSQTADAVGDATVLVMAAPDRIGIEYLAPTDVHESFDALVGAIEKEGTQHQIDLGAYPWDVTLSMIALLSRSGGSVEDLLHRP